MDDSFCICDINRVRQFPKRGQYDRATIFAILDAGFVAHVAFVDGDGRPAVMPMTYGHDGKRLFIHGSRISRVAQSTAGERVSIAVTLVDGLVVGRSMFEASMNYRSVVIHGRALRIEDEADKLHALRCVSEHMLPGRWDEVRPPLETELKATTVLAVEIEFASAKIRSGPAVQSDEVCADRTWFGVVPITAVRGRPIADLPSVNVPLPRSVAAGIA